MKNKILARVIFYSVFLFLITLVFVARNNLDKIYAYLGEVNYKKNNIEQSQKYFEKSFLLGNKNFNQREMYINSIINSPLTLNSQEKLINIAEDKIDDVASLRAQQFLYDLKRKIHDLYENNYIKQAVYNQKVVRWGKLPITYTFINTNSIPDKFISEKESEHQILFTKINETDANILIEFIENQTKEMEYGQKYIVAYTVPDVVQNKLQKMTIKFYLKDLEGNEFSANQIYNTALHEIFHALGFMGHSYNRDNIMYLSKDNNTLIKDSREILTPADISTLKLLYKIKPDITNSNELKSEYMPYLILGDDSEINSAKAKEAKNYINQAPTLASGYIDLAESFVAEKRYPEAIKSLEKALLLADTKEIQGIVYYNLAVVYFYINHLEMALDYLNQALDIKDTEELHYLLAEIYNKQGDEIKTVEEYNYLIKIAPQNIDYTINLTNFYIKKKDYINARKILKNFLKNNPQEKNNPRLSPYGLLKI